MIMIYAWLCVVVIAIVVEVAVPGLVSIWFVPSALLAMLLSLFDVPVVVQIIVFLVASAIFVFLSRKFIGRKKETKTNIDAAIGQKCIVTERIDNIRATGKVKLNGMDWTARAVEENMIFEIDDIVVVDTIEGVKLIVKK